MNTPTLAAPSMTTKQLEEIVDESIINQCLMDAAYYDTGLESNPALSAMTHREASAILTAIWGPGKKQYHISDKPLGQMSRNGTGIRCNLRKAIKGLYVSEGRIEKYAKPAAKRKGKASAKVQQDAGIPLDQVQAMIDAAVAKATMQSEVSPPPSGVPMDQVQAMIDAAVASATTDTPKPKAKGKRGKTAKA